MTLCSMQLVAHRAGNTVERLAPATTVADLSELDVHTFRGRLEVRHSKVVWPWRIYWERGVGIVRDERPVPLAEIIDGAPTSARLWVDLKGFSPRLTRRVLDEFRQRGHNLPGVVSCRSWWTLGPARRAGCATYRSVGNRWQLWLALRLRHPDGIVMHERFATPEALGRLEGRCPRVAVWAVDDLERGMHLHALGVDALIVDDLDLIAALRADPQDPAR